MTSRRFASFDLGSNSTLCLIADRDEADRLTVLEDLAFVTGLGRGLTASGWLLPEGMARVQAAIVRCLARARDWDVQEVVAVGTAAWRDASNGPAFASHLKQTLSLTVEIISGETEAALTWAGVCAGSQTQSPGPDCPDTRSLAPDGPPPRTPLIQVLDIGGRSTEWMVGRGSQLLWRHSYPLGTLSATERFLSSGNRALPVSPEAVSRLRAHIHELLTTKPLPETLRAALSPSPRLPLVGVAATALTFGQLDAPRLAPEALHGRCMSLTCLSEWVQSLAERSIEARKALPGLDPARAEPILAGGILLQQFMAASGTDTLQLSSWGLRHGRLLAEAAPDERLQMSGSR